MERLQTWLTLFSGFSILVFIGMALQLLRDIYRRIRYKQPIVWREYNPFANVHSLSDAVLPAVLVLGLLNLIGMEFFAKEEIGAFYEKSNYQAEYDAMLEINGDTTIFCIATVKREEGCPYRISKLSLPYGKKQFPNESDFKKDNDYISLSLGYEGWSCKLALDGLATESSYKALSSYEISPNGEFCASRESDTYHLSGCRYLKKIKAENLIYFENRCDAEVLGYSMCKTCRNRW